MTTRKNPQDRRGAYLEAAPYVWWSPTSPTEIFMTFVGGGLTNDAGEHNGMWITFSCNPNSMHLDRGNFNRLARWLRDQGKPAPAEVPIDA